MIDKNIFSPHRPRYEVPKMMAHIHHPCYGVDMTIVDNLEDEKILRGQGYADLDEIEELTGLSFEIDESNNFPFDTWKWLQDRSKNENKRTD